MNDDPMRESKMSQAKCSVPFDRPESPRFRHGMPLAIGVLSKLFPREGMAENYRVTRIADAIERYMREHPRAADTAEGVRSWWIANECRNDPPGEVQNALDLLAAIE